MEPAGKLRVWYPQDGTVVSGQRVVVEAHSREALFRPEAWERVLMKVLLTGGRGMLGRTLVRELSGDFELIPTDLPEADITDEDVIDGIIAQHEPDVVIHCAAMTAVDKCETERDLAFRLNARGTANVAASCNRHGVRLIAISTDPNLRSVVYGVGGNTGYWNADNRQGSDWQYAHEAGHLMGLGDDYTDAQGPNQGHDGHMMAEDKGIVVQHEVDDIMRANNIRCD